MSVVRVQHPTIPSVSSLVPAPVLDEWLQAGWITDPPPEELPRPATAKKTRASTK